MVRTNARALRRRTWNWLVLAAAVAGGPGAPAAIAQTMPEPDSAPSEVKGNDASVAVRLQTTLVDADYRGVDFDEIIDDLRRRHGLNIHIARHDLEGHRIRFDRRLDIRLNRISLATLLDVLIRELSSNGTGVEYQIDGGVIIISTVDGLNRNTFLQIYDVTDLFESGYARRRFANTPVLSLSLTGREFVGGERREDPGRGGPGDHGADDPVQGGSLFGEAADDSNARMEHIRAIVDLIQTHVDPDGWLDLGGDVGTIAELNGILLIKQSLRNHQRIAEFLEQMRASRPRPLDADAVIVRLRADRAAAWRRSIGKGFPRLPGAAVDHFLMAENDSGVMFRAATSGFAGQRMWFSALTQRDVLTGSAPIVGTQSNAFEPRTGFTTEGLELVAVPMLTQGTDDVTLDVQMAWIPPVQITERAVSLASPISALERSAPAAATIDQTRRSMRTVSTTTRLRLGEGLALTIPHALTSGAGEWEEWLIVRVRGR